MPTDVDACNAGDVNVDVLNQEPASQTVSPLVSVPVPVEGPPSTPASEEN